MKYGTFSYLPEMTPQQLRRQVEYIVARGWNAAIEHAEPGRETGSYWNLWTLPMVGETSADRILAVAEACHKAHPHHLVRLIGYDNLRQTHGTALLVQHA